MPAKRRPRKSRPTPPNPSPAPAAVNRPEIFVPPVRAPRPGERLLLVHAAGDRDPRLDDYIRVMRGHGHRSDELAVPAGDPHAARAAIRAHPRVRGGETGGIVLFGKQVPSFTVRYFYADRVGRGHADTPFGSDFPFFETAYEPLAPDNRPAWDIRRFAAELGRTPAGYRQSQWVVRMFSLADDRYLQNLEETVPPQRHNMLIVNADLWFPDDLEFTERKRRDYRARYGFLTQGHHASYRFVQQDFRAHDLAGVLEANLANTTFLSISDHGDSNNLDNLPPAQNGIAQLPRGLPDLVEYGGCAVGDWMEQDDPTKSVVEVTLERGALAVIGPQCLLAWYFAKGYVDPNPGSDPYSDNSFNAAPWLDVWPSQGSIGRAQAHSLTRNLSLLAACRHNDPSHVAYQMLCAHSLFGDGTLEFQSH